MKEGKHENAIALGYRTLISHVTAYSDRYDRRDTLVPASYLSTLFMGKNRYVPEI